MRIGIKAAAALMLLMMSAAVLTACGSDDDDNTTNPRAGVHIDITGAEPIFILSLSQVIPGPSSRLNAERHAPLYEHTIARA